MALQPTEDQVALVALKMVYRRGLFGENGHLPQQSTLQSLSFSLEAPVPAKLVFRGQAWSHVREISMEESILAGCKLLHTKMPCYLLMWKMTAGIARTPMVILVLLHWVLCQINALYRLRCCTALANEWKAMPKIENFC
jgi:hypothetical protein